MPFYKIFFPCETKKIMHAFIIFFFFFYGNTKLFNFLGCQDCSCVVNPVVYLFITGFVFIYPFYFLFKTLDHSNFRQVSNLLLISLKLAICCSSTYIILAVKVFDDQLLSLSTCSYYYPTVLTTTISHSRSSFTVLYIFYS